MVPVRSALALAATLIAAPALAETCAVPAPAAAIGANAASLAALVWAPFGRTEIGWRVYYPRIGVEIGTTCPPVSPGFAAKLAAWQGRHGLAATGAFDAETFAAMKAGWQGARPFVRANARENCPPPPPPDALAQSTSAEGYRGKVVALRASVLAAYRRMVEAARRDARVAAEPRAFALFSGYRDPESDAARCAAQGNCNGVVRARCSPHRTGLAIDLWVGEAPGFGPDSTADASRQAMTRTATYRWLLVNARRFGFVNYAFEPWHWEWTGEPI